jgi:hypothetical protein
MQNEQEFNETEQTESQDKETVIEEPVPDTRTWLDLEKHPERDWLKNFEEEYGELEEPIYSTWGEED